MFGKRIELLTFDDVVAFLGKGVREGLNLDYKERMITGAKIAKLACALANTSGGFIVFGAKEKGRAPQPPFDGGDLGNDPVQTVQNACRDYLTPRLQLHFSDVLRNSPDPSKAFLVVATPQSGLAPHVFKEAGSEEGFVYIKSEDHKEPVYPTLSRYEILRNNRELCKARADQLIVSIRPLAQAAWKKVRPATRADDGGRNYTPIPSVSVSVCRAYPETDPLASPQVMIERIAQYAVSVRTEFFQWSSGAWGPFAMKLPATEAAQLDTFGAGVLTNAAQQAQEVPLAAVMHDGGCFHGKAAIPLFRATPFLGLGFGDSGTLRRYVSVPLLGGFVLGLIRCAFRWFQAFGCYAAMRVRVSADSDNLRYWIVRPDEEKPAPPNTQGHAQQSLDTGYVIDEADFCGPGSPALDEEWLAPWPSEAEAQRISREITVRYVSAFNVRESAVADAFVNAVLRTAR
jgi:hypothetical protein